MTGDVVNLRQARKRRAREGAETRAAGNRARFGETKAARERREAERERGRRTLDGQKLTAPPDE